MTEPVPDPDFPRCPMLGRHWLLHTFRRTLGVAQVGAAVRSLSDGLTHRLDQIESRLGPAPATPPAPATGETLVEVNGDRMTIPNDLLKFVWHTRVSAEGAPVPQLLAETPHYMWVRNRLLPGDTALDIGANIGLFAVMMARRVKYGQVGTIHALEPSPSVFRDLSRVIAANRLDNVVLTQAAASDTCGRATFLDIQADTVNREASHLADPVRDAVTAGNADNRVDVETITIDAYVARHKMVPALIKMDIEGAEFLALEGGREFIAAHHPLMVIEIHPDATGVFDHARLRAYLDRYGYTYRHRDKTYYCE